MKKYLIVFPALAVMTLMTACETMNSRSSNQFASANQDVINLQNDVALLKRQMVAIRKNNAEAARQISSLQTQVSYVNEQNQLQNKNIVALNQALKSERTQRQAAMDKVVETVADQTAKTVNSITQRTPPPATTNSSGSLQAGAYYKHKVESGQTLSAIARAYKVSVKDIKQANNLKSDIIRVGQVLHIPKK